MFFTHKIWYAKEHHESDVRRRDRFVWKVLEYSCVYSVNSENVTQIKRYTAQILSYKIFSFCEQTLKIGANDASGQGLQYAL